MTRSTAGSANRNPKGVSSNNLCLPLLWSLFLILKVVAIMTEFEVLEESFSLDEFESSVIVRLVRCGYSSCLRGKANGEIFDRAKCWINSFCSSSCAHLWR
jgi:hypothetical protein